MIGEKKITKHFEYDLPSDLVLTFLSEVQREGESERGRER